MAPMHNLNYPDKRRPQRAWTADEIATLKRMRDVDGSTFRDIDRTLGRHLGSSRQKYELMAATAAGVAFGGAGSRLTVPPELEAARRARKDAESRMSLTSTFFGDPPPGYSALDRRTS